MNESEVGVVGSNEANGSVEVKGSLGPRLVGRSRVKEAESKPSKLMPSPTPPCIVSCQRSPPLVSRVRKSWKVGKRSGRLLLTAAKGGTGEMSS